MTVRHTLKKSAGTSNAALAAQPNLLTRTSGIVTRTIKAFFDDNITRLGAALAFYTTIAVAPLMVLAIAAAGILFSKNPRGKPRGIHGNNPKSICPLCNT